MNTTIQQIIYDMRTQPVIAWVTVIGTALSIFLIMTIVMMQQISLISFKPESHRDRMLYGKYINIANLDKSGDSSGSMSYDTAKKLYGDLEGVEKISYMTDRYNAVDAVGTTGEQLTADMRRVDEGFWEVFDYDLIAGRYFNAEEVAAERRVAVITESLGRQLFGGDNPIGQHFELNFNDYEVVGVVSDASKLASQAYGQVFVPIEHTPGWQTYFGSIMTAMLVKDGVDFESIRDQVKGRYARMDTELKTDGKKTDYHEAPFDQETIATGQIWSNAAPDPDSSRNLRLLLYAVLLIVPAINLSSMLHSRLRRRVNELGVRRAFGCTRNRIIRDIIAENLIVTVIGGIIGFITSLLFAEFYDGLYTNSNGETIRPALSLLLDWHILIFAFGACFILNIISASVPAWQASRMNPVNAINSK